MKAYFYNTVKDFQAGDCFGDIHFNTKSEVLDYCKFFYEGLKGFQIIPKSKNSYVIIGIENNEFLNNGYHTGYIHIL